MNTMRFIDLKDTTSQDHTSEEYTSECSSFQIELVRVIKGEDAKQICHLHSESDVARARYMLNQLLDQYQIDALKLNRLITAVSEVGSNAVRYGKRGVICVWVYEHFKSYEVVVKVADEGPGISNLAWAFTDHNSSGGTLGLGLSGASRLVDHFEVTSPLPHKNHGTLVTLMMTWSLS